MKTKIILSLMFAIVSSIIAHGQTNSDTYVIGTSVPISMEYHSGLLKWTSNMVWANTQEPSLTFHINAPEKGYDVCISYYPGMKYPRGRYPVIIEMERSQLANLSAIDVVEFIRTHDKEQAEEWAKARINKTIWVIDRNDFFISLTTGKEMMKLIEATVSSDDYPEEPNIIVVE